MNKVGDEAYNEAWGVQGWSIAEKLMHRAEIAEYVCEQVMAQLSVENFSGEVVVEMGIGFGTSALPYVARGASVIGYDANASMVNKADRLPNVSAKKGNPNIHQDICIEMPDGSVSLYLLMGVNRYLCNQGQENLFRAVSRTLKATGLLVMGLWKTEREAAVNLWGPGHRTFPWDMEEALVPHGLAVESAEYVIHGEGNYCPAWFLYIGKKKGERVQRSKWSAKAGKRKYKGLQRKRLDQAHYERIAKNSMKIISGMS